ncbi:MAG: dependent oxidoreductase [Frankiales bacterium]|nr:dependent oxidoreductase [Frankiales bacterium]
MTEPLWEDGGWSPLAPLHGDVTVDVCVVGLGGSGLAAVDELRSRGASVVGVDAGIVGGGAAGRNGGFLLAGLAPAYHEVVARLGREKAAQLYSLTLGELDRICTATPEAVRRVGSLRIEDDEAGLADCSAQEAAMRADGFAVEPYDGPEGRGLLFPDDAAMQPLVRCRWLAQQAVRGGAVLHEQSPVLSVEPGQVTTPGGSVSCSAVVVAVDGRLDLLLPELAGTVRTVRLQMLGTAPTAEVTVPRPVYLRGGYEYWQQLPDGRLAVGGFRDVGGDGEETTSAEPSEPVQSALERLLRARLGVTAPVTHRWAASVGYTRSGLPYLGEVRDGVWVAGGYCGTGNVIGALCGRAAAARALGQEHPATAFERLV